MKSVIRKKFLIAFSVFVVVAFTSCHYRHNTNISIQEKRDSYQFYATYNERKTKNVWHYLNAKLDDSEIYFSDDNYYNVTTVLHDDTRLYIKSSPGRIKIKLDKRDNTEASYERVKHICEGLKDVLK